LAWVSVFAQLLGPTIAALVALQWWRVQAIGKRKAEIAENAIVTMNKSILILSECRIPVHLIKNSNNALRDIEAAKMLIEKDDNPLAHAYKKIDANAQELRKLSDIEILCDLYFPHQNISAFSEFEIIKRKLFAASFRLTHNQEMARIKGQLEPDLVPEWKSIIWRLEKNDALDQEMTLCINKLTAELSPFLSDKMRLTPNQVSIWLKSVIARRNTTE
jgi:hypothetical protein